MATTYIVIDHSEKRIVRGHHDYLNEFLSALAENPATIAEFNSAYEGGQRHPFFSDGNRPSVPQDLSVDSIRQVLGMPEEDLDHVLGYWRETSHYRGPNYESARPDQKTDHDIPSFYMDEAETTRRKKLNPLYVDSMELQVGYSLIGLLDGSLDGDLLARIAMIRREMREESGFVLQPIRIRDNMELAPNEYMFIIKKVGVASGQVEADKLLAIDTGLVGDKIEGVEITEPLEDCPAVWIDKTLRGSWLYCCLSLGCCGSTYKQNSERAYWWNLGSSGERSR